MNELQRRLVLGVECIMNAAPSVTPAATARDHRLGVGDGQAERFFAQNVLARAAQARVCSRWTAGGEAT